MPCVEKRKPNTLRRMTVYHVESATFSCDRPVLYIGFLDKAGAERMSESYRRTWMAGWQFVQLGEPLKVGPDIPNIICHPAYPRKTDTYRTLMRGLHIPDEAV